MSTQKPQQPSPPPPSPPLPPPPPNTLIASPHTKKGPSKSTKIFRQVRSIFRSLPIISTPSACKFPASHHHLQDHHIHGGRRMTGTLFGCRKSRINLAIQENPRCIPMLILELSIPTEKLLRDMALGLVRMALECEKHEATTTKKKSSSSSTTTTTKLMEEPIWTLYCNGRKMGYGVKREATNDDLNVMQMLHAMSIGAGVLPSDTLIDSSEGELTYMRAYFERVIGSKDSETYYMMNPDGNTGPELSIFFVRI